MVKIKQNEYDVKKSPLPIIAISACLAGQLVRYDGQHKYMPQLMAILNEFCTVLTICPETAIGLPVPRNKIQLISKNESVRVLDTCYPHKDFTDLLENYTLNFLQQHSLSGIILQEKSPSCGIDNCKVFSESGELTGYSSGIFAATILKKIPTLPNCCAKDLGNAQAIEAFIKRVSVYSKQNT